RSIAASNAGVDTCVFAGAAATAAFDVGLVLGGTGSVEKLDADMGRYNIRVFLVVIATRN
ncbi:MAG TPA: hypothetical protein VF447_02085, partial [Terriglobales bacterium]